LVLIFGWETWVINNIASNNGYGIYLEDSSDSTLQSNTMSGNTYNFGVYDGSLSEYAQNIDTSNTVDGKPIYYWIGQQDKQIIGDAGFVGLVNCTNITVKDLTLTNNTYGVLFAYTKNSRIENVTASNNTHDGICLEYSDNNTLTGNTANSNSGFDSGTGIPLCDSDNNTLQSNTANSNAGDGIHLWRYSNNTLQSNTANSSGWGDGICLSYSSNNTLHSNIANSNDWCGIRLSSSSNSNTLYHNNLISNTKNAYDDTGTDGDDIGNDLHPIPGGTSVDRYPLIYPWTAAPQKGDLNGDDILTPADTAIVLAFAAGGGSTSCDPAMLAAADVSGDGSVTSLDALMILQAAAGAIEL
jgi:parallel beta-helix repeat protein